MKTKWPTVALGEVLASIRPGVSVSSSREESALGESVGILTLGAVSGGRFNPRAFKPVPSLVRDRLGPSVAAGTILMSRSNTADLVGTAALVPKDHCDLYLPDLLWELRVRRPGPSAGWITAYLATDQAREELTARASGTSGSMKKLSIRRLRTVPIVVLPADHEARALAYLAALEHSERTVEQLLAAKRRLKRALMQRLLDASGPGWREASLNDLARFQNGLAFNEQVWGRSGLPIIRIQNLNGSRDFNFFRGEVPAESIVNSGDILFGWSGSRGTSFGSHVWRGPVGVLNQHIFKVTPRDGIRAKFLAHLLAYHTPSIEACAHGAAGLVHVTKSELLRYRVMVPTSEEQQERIENALGVSERMVDAASGLLAALRLQKRGVMQKVLSGDLDWFRNQ